MNAASLVHIDITIPLADARTLIKILRQRTRPLTPSIVLSLMDDPSKNSWEVVKDLVTMHRHTNAPFLKNVVHRMHSVTVFIRRSLDGLAVAAIRINEQDECCQPNCHIAAEQAFLAPLLQCIKDREHPFTSLKVEILNEVTKLRKLKKMLAPLKAFKVRQADIRFDKKHPVAPGKWKKGYVKIIKEVRDAMMEKNITAAAHEGSSGGEVMTEHDLNASIFGSAVPGPHSQG